MIADICVYDGLELDEGCARLMEQTAAAACGLFAVEHPRVNIAVMNDESIHGLNLRYRGIDRPTDVLSFANREGDTLLTKRKGEYLGDIAISLPTAIRQAGEYGHSKERELAFLTAHGMLHLLGYDHMTPEDEKEMRGLQNEVMEAVGLSLKE